VKKEMSETTERLSRELQESLDTPIDTKTITVLPSASATDRFLACAYPWGKVVDAFEGEVDAAARFGSAFHEGLAFRIAKKGAQKHYRALAKKYGDDINPSALRDRIDAAYPVLTTWLGGDNPWGIDFTRWELHVEKAYAYNIEAETARWCDNASENHEYLDRQPNELPGTADVIAANSFRRNNPKWNPPKFGSRNFVLILDHKSGWEVGSPRESGQLRSLALGGCRLYNANRAIVAFLHAPENMAPTVYADTLDADDLKQHAADLRDANARAGDGSMKPGEHCKYCRVFSVCPTNAGALVQLRGSFAIRSAEDAGLAHQTLGEFRRRFASIDAAVDAEIRAWITKHGDALRPDGREVGFVERDYTNLSQASIVRALGKLEGGRLIQKLKKLGCIEESKRRELRVK
jgi:uncharacterized protein DUF2800